MSIVCMVLSISCPARMAEVSRRVGREASRLGVLKNRSHQKLSRIDNRQTRGVFLEFPLLDGAVVYDVNTDQRSYGMEAGGVCCKWQLSQTGRVSRDSFGECGDRSDHGRRGTVLEGPNLSKSEKDVFSVNGWFSSDKWNFSASDLMSLELYAKQCRKCTHKIQDIHACHILCMDYDNHLCSLLGIQNLSVTETQCLNREDPDFCCLSPDTLTHTHGRIHRIFWEKPNFLTVISHTTPQGTSRQQQRAFCTVLNVSNRHWNYCVQPICSGAMPFYRMYSWKGKNSSSGETPLHRSKTAYYDILKVSPSATQAQIKTAYYKQSFIHHPDKNAGSEEAVQRFSEISEAYAVLGSVALRRKYDRGILSKSDVQGAGRPPGQETRSSSTTGQHQARSRHTHATGVGGKPMFDFDAFYQAHYGEQLQREQELRRLRERWRRRQQEGLKEWKFGNMTEISLGMMLALATFILFSLKSGE